MLDDERDYQDNTPSVKPQRDEYRQAGVMSCQRSGGGRAGETPSRPLAEVLKAKPPADIAGGRGFLS